MLPLHAMRFATPEVGHTHLESQKFEHGYVVVGTSRGTHDVEAGARSPLTKR